jgi:hypothetical protein
MSPAVTIPHLKEDGLSLWIKQVHKEYMVLLRNSIHRLNCSKMIPQRIILGA